MLRHWRVTHVRLSWRVRTGGRGDARLVYVNETWMSIPEVAEALGARQRDVRTMLEDRTLLAVRRGPNNALAVCSLELVEKGEKLVPLKSLRGTLTRLSDAGFTDDEAMRWLLEANDLLEGERPIDLLRAGNIHGVRRVIL